MIPGRRGARERLLSDTESRLEQFTKLVAIAIASAESRAELAASEARAGDLDKEQAALRRVATLVAEGAGADQLLAAVSEEVGRLFDTDQVAIGRFDRDGRSMVVVGVAEGTRGTSIGARWRLPILSSKHLIC